MWFLSAIFQLSSELTLQSFRDFIWYYILFIIKKKYFPMRHTANRLRTFKIGLKIWNQKTLRNPLHENNSLQISIKYFLVLSETKWTAYFLSFVFVGSVLTTFLKKPHPPTEKWEYTNFGLVSVESWVLNGTK